MRTRPALASLTLTATALIGGGLLAGCGQTSPTADTPEPTPSFSVSTAAPDGETTGTPSSSPTGASPSTGSSTQPSTTGTPKSPSTPATPAASDSPTAPPAGTVHTYRNLTVRLPVADDAVPDAPQGLTAYLRRALTADWKRLGGSAGCQKGGMVTISATRSDGFAYVMRDVDPSLQNCPKAASMAGGYRAVWKDVDGTWKQVLGMQDVPACSEFEKWGVPSDLLGADAQCLQGDDVVPYRHS